MLCLILSFLDRPVYGRLSSAQEALCYDTHSKYIFLPLKTCLISNCGSLPILLHLISFYLLLFSSQNIKLYWVLAPQIGTGKLQWARKLNFIFHCEAGSALAWCIVLSVSHCYPLTWQQKNLPVCICSWWEKYKERRIYRLIFLPH